MLWIDLVYRALRYHTTSRGKHAADRYWLTSSASKAHNRFMGLKRHSQPLIAFPYAVNHRNTAEPFRMYEGAYLFTIISDGLLKINVER